MDFERQKFFWSRVRKESDHLIWEGSATPRGYGKMFVDGKLQYAHRVSWCIANNYKTINDIDDLVILRTCDRNDCVAPVHLAQKKKKPGKTKTDSKTE
jgi:hypothetical protein